MKKHPKHAAPKAAAEDEALDPVEGFDDIDAGDDLAAGDGADLEVDAALDDVEGLDAGDALDDAGGLEVADDLEGAEGLEVADEAVDGLEAADELEEADEGLAIAGDEALEAEGDAEGLDDVEEDDAPRRAGDTGECPPIANNDTPLATIEEPPVISAAHPGEAPMVEVADGHGGSVTLCQVLPLEYLENKEDFPNLFPSRPKPASLRRTTSARASSRRAAAEEELTPEQLEMRRKQDARAKLIIYGGLALVTLAFLVLLSMRLPYLASLCGKKMDHIWPWSLIWPPEPKEEDEAAAPAKAAKKKAPKPAPATSADADADDADAEGDGDAHSSDDAGEDKAAEDKGDGDAEKKKNVVTEQPADGDW